MLLLSELIALLFLIYRYIYAVICHDARRQMPLIDIYVRRFYLILMASCAMRLYATAAAAPFFAFSPPFAAIDAAAAAEAMMPTPDYAAMPPLPLYYFSCRRLYAMPDFACRRDVTMIALCRVAFAVCPSHTSLITILRAS